MILVDKRAGSHELVALLGTMGLPVEETTLDFGDLLFEGQAQGKSVSVVIEHKKIGDLVNAFRTGRLPGHQALGMQEFDYRYLLIEGELLYDRYGLLLRRRGRRAFSIIHGGMTIGELMKRVWREQLEVGLTPIFSHSRRDTLKLIEALYHVWTEPGHSHIAIHTPPTLLPLSQFRKTVLTLPEIGVRTSAAVEKFFGSSLRYAFNASLGVWADIPITNDKGKTRKLGAKDAAKIVAALE